MIDVRKWPNQTEEMRARLHSVNRALASLRLEVPGPVAEDLQARVEAALTEALDQSTARWEVQNTLFRAWQGMKRVAVGAWASTLIQSLSSMMFGTSALSVGVGACAFVVSVIAFITVIITPPGTASGGAE